MSENEADIFADLHQRLAREFHNRLTKGACEHCGRTPATVQELEAIRKFLSDNGITDGLHAGSPMNNIVADLPFAVEDPDAPISRPALRIV